MKIAVDLEGGDKAPKAVLDAVSLVIRKRLLDPGELVAIGLGETVRHLHHRLRIRKIETVECQQTVGMKDNLKQALYKKDSSIAKGMMGVKDGKFDAFISAGNTVAMVGSGVYHLGRLKKNVKPALAVPIPNRIGPCLILDVGAINHCEVNDYLHLAQMGNIYAKHVWGIANPKIGLLNIGSESTKGDKTLQTTHHELSRLSLGLNFIGNVEADDILNTDLNVVVCQGSVGNPLLKFGEGVVELVSYKLGLIWKAMMFFDRFTRGADYKQIGGAPLLGIEGNVIIAHGKSTAVVLANAIKLAAVAVRHDINKVIAQEINDKTP